MIEFTTPKHKTNILPLRWFANWCNHLSAPFLATAVHIHYEAMEGNAHAGFKFHFNAFMYNFIDKPYKKWGTTYEVDMEKWKEYMKNDPVFGKLGSDYDEDGIPYWEKDDN